MSAVNHNDSETTRFFLDENKVVVNIGLKVFEEAMIDQGVKVININWKPQLKHENDLEKILNELL